ncbi:MAG: neutral zinc metallopeptidase [Geminicoccaceae bacterium]
MRWQMGRRSENIEDRRGMSPGMGRGIRVGGAGGLGILAIALVAMFLGVDPSIILNSIPGDVGGSQSDVAPRSAPAPGDTGAEFVSAVLAQTEDTWTDIFAQAGQQYQDPQLVLFDGSVQSACGMAASATGPFYCPGDRKVYLDLSFFRELQERFGASGDFADAYVIAHEVGHHVQTLLGTSEQVTRARSQADQATANELSVRLELQADCYAGIWARHMQERQGVVEDGDIEEALGAASAVGDDRIQKATRGYVVPESFTHGTAQQRMRWFKQGLQTNDPNSCDTFGADRL